MVNRILGWALVIVAFGCLVTGQVPVPNGAGGDTPHPGTTLTRPIDVYLGSLLYLAFGVAMLYMSRKPKR